MERTFIYIVAWTGGYEAPQYEVKATEADAFTLAHEWMDDAEEGVDTCDVLRVNLADLSITRLEADDGH